MSNGIGKVFAKRLHDAFDRTAGQDNVDKALNVLRGKLDPCTVPETQGWVDACYNRPSDHELVLHACDVLLGTHGVESLGPGDLRYDPPFEYLNTGDSYALTIVYDTQDRRFFLSSWGDIAEKYMEDPDWQ